MGAVSLTHQQKGPEIEIGSNATNRILIDSNPRLDLSLQLFSYNQADPNSGWIRF